MSLPNSFDFLFARCKELQKKRVAVVCPYEADALTAIEEARKAGYVDGVLFGEIEKMKPAADKTGVSLGNFETVEAAGEEKAAEAAVRAVSSGSAALLMKGFIKTATLLKAVLNKEWGLRPEGESLLSHVMFAEIPLLDNRIVAVTDGGMNIYPDVMTKAAIIDNAVSCLRKLGAACPKVAVLSVAEQMYIDVPATDAKSQKSPAGSGKKLLKAAEDAAVLCKMNERGIIKNCEVNGPMGLEAAMFGGRPCGGAADIGAADILLVPDIESGNALGKVMSYIAGATCAGVLLGARSPVIMLSRHNTARTKLCSIALGAVISE